MTVGAIIDWAGKQAAWKQDALRRLALSPEMKEGDLSAILDNLFQEKGIERESAPECKRLSKEHLVPDAQLAPLARLCSIDKVKNANRLASGQHLPFALDGVTLIYGHNASGKSGYCRILKRFCRALVKDEIHSDVFANKIHGPAEARIRYKLHSESDVRETLWRDGEDGPTDIANLSVFDSHNARLYVDARNRIDYLPYEIELLTRFGGVLIKLQERVSEMSTAVDGRLRVGLPIGYTPGSPIHALMEQMKPEVPLEKLPTVKEIEALGAWTVEREQTLEELKKTTGDDPKVAADRCRRVHGVVRTLIDQFKKARKLLSSANVKALEQAVTKARVTAEAASLAATELFGNEPLLHVGSNPWQLMFQYAKEYTHLTYPGIEPPAAREGDLCVLCQQPLGKEAADRLRRFENYIAGEAKKEARIAAVACDELASTFNTFQIRSAREVKTLLAEFGGMSDSRAMVAADAEAFVITTDKHRKTLVEAVKSGDLSDAIDIDHSIIDVLAAELNILIEEAIGFEKVAGNDEQRELLKKRLAELQDRKRLSENLETILARRKDLELRARLQECMGASNTGGVSRKVSSLRMTLVTENLNDRIRSEITRFGLAHIPLLINDVSRKAESRVAVTLDAYQKVASKDVLSEGEQRALGLACFLADVNGQPVKHGIIIDDPVSSLDHVRVRSVAKRLISEASTGRQVIVFTHNLLFFSEMISSAAAHMPQQVPVFTNIIRKSEEFGFGLVEKDDRPWESKSVTKRIIILREED